MSKSIRQNKKVIKNIYLDYAASATANPSSIHSAGVKIRNILEGARLDVARVLSARGSEIIFTSGGTESNNIAIQGVVFAWHEKKREGTKILPHIITTNIEHPSVLETCRLLKRRRLALFSVVAVERNGIVDPKKIKKEIKENTVLVSVHYANNEIGTIQPIAEIAKEIRHWKKKKKVQNSESFFPYFHTDAVQAVNYLDLNTDKLGVDMLSLSGSKVLGVGLSSQTGGRGVGVLFKRKNLSLVNIFGGGDQEMGLRPGTENVEAISKFSEALVFMRNAKEKEIKRLKYLRDYFLNKIFKNTKNSTIAENLGNYGIILNGDLENHLPNNINISIPKIPSELMVIELSQKGIMVSAKSACKSGESGGSYVIEALRDKDDKLPKDGLRFSLGSDTTKKDIDYTVKSLFQILQKLKKWYN